MLQSIECEFIPNEGCEFGKRLANRHAGSIRVQSTFCTATVIVLYSRQRGVGARKSLHSIFCGVYLLLPTRWNITKSDTSETPWPYYVWNANVYISTVKKKEKRKSLIVPRPARTLRPDAISGVRASRPNRHSVGVE